MVNVCILIILDITGYFMTIFILLLGYRLVFGGHDSSRWGGHIANIQKLSLDAVASSAPLPSSISSLSSSSSTPSSAFSSTPPSHVWGTVWRIHKDNLAALDEQESVGSGLYEPISVETEPTDKSLGDKLLCRTYQVTFPSKK